jgi:predicted exporter
MLFTAGQHVLLVKNGFPIDTDIMDLFPPTEKDASVERSIRVFGENIGQKLVFLVGHTDAETAMAAADYFHEQLLLSEVFAEIDYVIDEDRQSQQLQQFFEYRFYLLSDRDRALLLAGEEDSLFENAHRALFNPAGFLSPGLLERDPLFLLQNYLSDLPGIKSRMTLNEQRLVADHEGITYYFINTRLQGSPFSIEQQDKVSAVVADARTEISNRFPGVQILSSGVLRHAAAGTERATREISTIGACSVAGVLLLILLAFRSLTPLLICLTPILAGVGVALLACVTVFGSVHLFTLVFGASLIGISVDYSLHYLSDRLMGGPDWRADRAIRRILPGITLGLITTSIGFTALSITPFPGLRQIAVFSAVGLATAYLTVISVFPLLLTSPYSGTREKTEKIYQTMLSRIWELRSSRFRIPFILLLIVICVLGIARIHVNDDISALQTISESLRAEDTRVAEIIGSGESNQFFMVRDESPQAVLETEERLRTELAKLIKRGELESWRGMSALTPSVKRQAENIGLLRDALLGESQKLAGYMRDIGYSDEAIAANVDSLTGFEQQYMQYENMTDNTLVGVMDFLWLGKTGDGYASIVTLTGLRNPAACIEVENALDNVVFVNKVADISDLFKRYRTFAGMMVAVAYAGIFVMLILRYRFVRATAIILPPVAAAILTIAIIGYLQEPFSLFNALALLLVLGIGIDYTLFFAEADGGHVVPTAIAITLSALTTIMSFGFLAMSDTQAIHAFGVTVFCGVSLAFLFSLLASRNLPDAVGLE